MRISNGSVVGRIDLENATVDNVIVLDDIRFSDKVCFRFTRFKKALTIANSRLGEADFLGATIGGQLTLQGSEFSGRLRLSRAEIAGDLDADLLRCTDPDEKATFFQAHVRKSAFFEKAEFFGGISLRNFSTGVDFDLSMTQIFKEIELCYTTVGSTFWIFDIGLPEERASTLIRGLRYRDIMAGPQQMELRGAAGEELGVSPSELLEFVDGSAFCPDSYKSLAFYLDDQGYGDWADRAFVRGKFRELSYLPVNKKLSSLFLMGTVGHGRYPWLAFVWSIGFVTLGAVLFAGRLEQRPETGEARLSGVLLPLWYSLDSFVPAVDLEAKERWTLRVDAPRIVRIYWALHVVLG